MKNRLLLTLVLLLITTLSFSQDKKRVKRSEIEAKKKAFILKTLNLSDEEEAKFWPVYQRYDQEMDAVRKQKRRIRHTLKNDDVLSDDEVYNLTVKLLNLEANEAEIRLKYLTLFSNVVGKGKASLVFKAEEQFKRELFKSLKNNPPPPPPPPSN